MTPRQTAILQRVKARDVQANGPETGPEMVSGLWMVPGLFTSIEQGQRTCKQLVAKGYLCELGFSETGARCYGLAGRDEAPKEPSQ